MKIVLLMALTLTACAEDKALLITGDTMVTLADQFVAVAAAMDEGLDKHTISPAQYNEWKAFGTKFQQTYPLAVHLWQVASDHHDATMQSQLSAMVMTMAGDLTKYALVVGVKL